MGLFGFGVAFIFKQSTIIATAQEKLPHMKGTAMALAAFNMFLGAGVGTSINGWVMETINTTIIFNIASYLFLIVGILAAIFVSQFEAQKKKSYASETL